MVADECFDSNEAIRRMADESDSARGREPGTATGDMEFWTMLNGIMTDLGEDYVAVGASEMARLAHEACKPDAKLPSTPSCAVASAQVDCSPTPGKAWHNSSQVACEKLGCCWHAGGVRPSGHTCIHKETPAPTCLKPKAERG